MAGMERGAARDVSRSMEPVYSVVGAAQIPTGLSTEWVFGHVAIAGTSIDLRQTRQMLSGAYC